MVLIVDKPSVCQRGCPAACKSKICGQRPGRECIFTHSSQSSIHVARKACLWLLLLTGLTSACFRHRRRPPCAPQKMPEMTYTPSFLIRASFFRDFVNTLKRGEEPVCVPRLAFLRALCMDMVMGLERFRSRNQTNYTNGGGYFALHRCEVQRKRKRAVFHRGGNRGFRALRVQQR